MKEIISKILLIIIINKFNNQMMLMTSRSQILPLLAVLIKKFLEITKPLKIRKNSNTIAINIIATKIAITTQPISIIIILKQITNYNLVAWLH